MDTLVLLWSNPPSSCVNCKRLYAEASSKRTNPLYIFPIPHPPVTLTFLKLPSRHKVCLYFPFIHYFLASTHFHGLTSLLCERSPNGSERPVFSSAKDMKQVISSFPVVSLTRCNTGCGCWIGPLTNFTCTCD